MIEAGRTIHGFVHRGRWLEFGTPELFLEGSFALLRAGGDPMVVPRMRDRAPDEQLWVAAEEYPELDVPAYLARLDAMAQEAEPRVRGAGSLAERVDCLVDSGVVLPADTRLRRAMVVPWSDDQANDRPLHRLGDCGIAEF